MSNRVVFALVCLVVLALVPLAGCTPPASQDVQFVGSVTDGGSCCPGSTGAGFCGPGFTGAGICGPGSTAVGDLAVATPGTTASL